MRLRTELSAATIGARCWRPAYSSHCSPQELVCREIRRHPFAKQDYDSMDAVKQALERRLRNLERAPLQIQSLTGFDWLVNVECEIVSAHPRKPAQHKRYLPLLMHATRRGGNHPLRGRGLGPGTMDRPVFGARRHWGGFRTPDSRSSPAIAEGKVVTLGVSGRLPLR